MTQDEVEWQHVDLGPSSLSQLCLHMGVQDVQIEPVMSIERDFLCDQRPVYGIIIFSHHTSTSPFLSKDEHRHHYHHHNDRIYFANQVVNNAYAMHALLSILLNCDIIDIGPTLLEFKQFTKDFPPLVKGLSLSNSHPLRESQNRVARQWPPQDKQHEKSFHHYVSYIPFEGYLWELDGLKRGPLRLGPCTDKNWLDMLQFELVRKTESYQKQDIPYSMWSLIEDRRKVLQRKLVIKLYNKGVIERQLDGEFSDWRMTIDVRQWEEEYQHAMKNNALNRRGMDVSNDMSSYCRTINDLPTNDRPDVEAHHQQQQQQQKQQQQQNMKEWIDIWLQSQDEILRLYNGLGKEDEKHKRYENDVLRQRHDYFAFIKQYLEALQTHGILQNIIPDSL